MEPDQSVGLRPLTSHLSYGPGVTPTSPAPRLPQARRLALVLGAAALTPALVLAHAPDVVSPTPAGARTVTRLNTYWGSTHAHTGASNTHGKDEATTEQVFDAARGNGFDFFMLTEHTGPTGPRNPDQFFADAQRIAAEMTTKRFAAISGYEYSDNRNDGDTDRGHITVIGTEDFVNARLPGMDFTTFLAHLVEVDADRTVLAGFAHPPAAGHGAARPTLLTPESRRMMALSETHNHATYRQAREEQYYAALIAELDAGWRVAPACGLDDHGVGEVLAVESVGVDPCRTGVLAPSLSPARIIKAMLARRVFATRDMNLHVRYRANDRWMGAQLDAPGRVQFSIRARDPDLDQRLDRVSRIEVVGTGGAVLASRTFDEHRVLWRPRVRTGDNTYMLVRVFTDDHPTATALAAPVWLSAR